MRGLLCALAGLGCLAAQTTSEEGVEVAGRAVNSTTGQPVAGAYVRLSVPRGERLETSADAAGRFQFEGVKPERYLLSASAPGPMEARGYVNVVAGRPVPKLELELEPAGVIAGRVTDSDGRPVAGAYVHVLYRSADQERGLLAWRTFRRRTLESAYTNDRGEYRVWGLPPGGYVIAALPPLAAAPLGVLRFSSAPTLHPNAQVLEEASSIQLAPGQTREGLDIRLGPAGPTTQSLRLTPPPSLQDCRDCRISIYQRDRTDDLQIVGGLINLAHPDRGGALEIVGLSPGDYLAVSWIAAQAHEGTFGHAEFSIREEANPPVAYPILPPAPIRGRVILHDQPDESETAPETGNPFLEHNLARTEPLLRDIEKSQVCRSETVGLSGDGAARPFEIVSAPGRCRLEVRGPRGSYLAGLDVDGRPLETPEVDIPPAGLTDVVAHVRFDLGKITGRIERYSRPGDPGLEPYPDVLMLVPARSREAWNRLTYMLVQPDGSFEVSLAPGDYQIVAGRWGGRAMLNRIAEQTRDRLQVAVKPGETSTLTVPADFGP